jgi:hypothetical protein
MSGFETVGVPLGYNNLKVSSTTQVHSLPIHCTRFKGMTRGFHGDEDSYRGLWVVTL